MKEVMKAFTALLIAVAAFYTGSVISLRCFECKLSDQTRCARHHNLPNPYCPEPNMTIEEKKAANIHAVCIKTTKPSKNPNNTYPYTNRTCGLFNGTHDDCGTLIENERLETGAVLSCYSCEKEMCNDASFSNEKIWIVLISTIVGLVLCKWN